MRKTSKKFSLIDYLQDKPNYESLSLLKADIQNFFNEVEQEHACLNGEDFYIWISHKDIEVIFDYELSKEARKAELLTRIQENTDYQKRIQEDYDKLIIQIRESILSDENQLKELENE